MTPGRPSPLRLTVRPLLEVLAALVLAVSVAACELGFTDRGGSFVADNRSDVAVLARIKSTVSTGSGLGAAYEIVEVPALSRLVIAVQGFSGDQVTAIEMLNESCKSIGTFFGFVEHGRVIRIDDGPTAMLIAEWPQDTEPKAKMVDACRVPEASPSP